MNPPDRFLADLLPRLGDEQLAGYIARRGWVARTDKSPDHPDLPHYRAEHARRVRAKFGM